jgi:ubiquinone/menaquinone biosynthesis C-methylase UbiE
MLKLVTPNVSLSGGHSGISDSGIEVTPPGIRVISAMDLGEETLKRCGIARGMRVFDLGCGAGASSLSIAKLVGPAGLVVGIDTSVEAIEVAERRAILAGRCYWTRFVSADFNSFVPPERFNAAVVRLTLLRHAGRTTYLRLSTYVRSYGVILIAWDKSDGHAGSSVRRNDSRWS